MFESLVADDAVLALRRAERQATRLWLHQLTDLLELMDSSRTGSVGQQGHAIAEAATALHLGETTIARRLHAAEQLRDRAVLHGYLHAGRLAVPHGLAALDELDELAAADSAARLAELGLDRDAAVVPALLAGLPVEQRAAAHRQLCAQAEQATGALIDAAERAVLGDQVVLAAVRRDETALLDEPPADTHDDATSPAAAGPVAAGPVEGGPPEGGPAGPGGQDRWSASGWSGTPGELVRALRRAAVRLDPDAAERRRRHAVPQRTGVCTGPGRDGLARLVVSALGVQVQAAKQLLTVLAAPTGPDDTRSRGQREVDALLQALVVRAGGGVPLELELQIPANIAVAGVVAQTGLPEPIVIRPDLTPELLALLAGTTATGPAAAVALPPPTTRDDTGHPAALAHAVPPDHSPAAQTRPEPSSRSAWTCSGEGPEVVGLGHADTALLKDLLSAACTDGLPVGLGAIRVRRVLVDHHGHALAVDSRTVPLTRLSRHHPPASTRPASTPSGHQHPGDQHSGDQHSGDQRSSDLLRALLHALPTPPPRTSRYRPTAAQERLVQTRDRTCTFPGCHRPARASQLDHLEPWQADDTGGPTSTGNLHCLCQRHHRLKHDGWQVTRHADGSSTWTSPRGSRHHSPAP